MISANACFNSGSLSLGSVIYDNANDMSDRFDWHIIYTKWYSQFNATGNWNAAGLDNVYFGSKDSQPVMNGTNNCLMRKGCFAASAAMILRNLGATMYGYDVRNSDAGMHRMQADPFTVLMANCKTNGAGWSVADGKIILANNSGRSANFVIAEDVAEGFKIGEDEVDVKPLSGFNSNETHNKELIKQFLLENPQGVLVAFKRANGTKHAVVVVGFKQLDNGLDFIICDPGVEASYKGQMIEFENSRAKSSGCSFSSINNVNTY